MSIQMQSSALAPSKAALPTRDAEWSRSRYWFCHFLQSRHTRPGIDWETPLSQTGHLTAESTLHGMIHRLTTPQAGIADIITTAQKRFGHDPAFVQSLRLLAKERQFHHGLLLQLQERHQPQALLPAMLQARKEMTASLLGIRYFLASLLLDDILDLGLLRLAQQQWTDPAALGVCQTLIRDKTAHATFLAERLTMEYADFNFMRRNLRRLRLRSLFFIHLRRMLRQDHALLAVARITPREFARQSWQRFAAVLESMVPYRRDELMKSLKVQSEKPYGEAREIAGR